MNDEPAATKTPERTAYELEDFAQLDASDQYTVIPYSLLFDFMEMPLPVAVLIIKETEYISFAYFEYDSDTWIIESTKQLENQQVPIPVDTTEYFGDGIGFVGTDCTAAIQTYKQVKEQLETEYKISSIEPAEQVTESEIDFETCTDKCTGTETFEYYNNSNTTLNLEICRDCHEIEYIHYNGKKHTPESLTTDFLFENSTISVHETNDSEKYFIEGDNPGSLYDGRVAVLWWDAFRKRGGIQKYAPELQRSVLCMDGTTPVGYITWQYLKNADNTPIIRDVYFQETVTTSEIQSYYTNWQSLVTAESYYVDSRLNKIEYSPIQVHSENATEFFSITPVVTKVETDANENYYSE